MSVKTVEAWEAGTNKPIGAARRFLSVLKADPNLLVKKNYQCINESTAL